jgi:GNAT superfamily N-acetyltransferase
VTVHDDGRWFGCAVCESADIDDLVRLLVDVVVAGEPLTVALGITPAEFEPYVRLLAPLALADGLSVVARRAGTGEAVGALLALDAAAALPDGIHRLGERSDFVNEFLARLDADYRGDRAPLRGESMHLMLLGVAPAAAGKGVARALVVRALAAGRRRGYRTAVTEATSRASQQVFRALGFAVRVQLGYLEHRAGGRAVFASAAAHGGAMLMDVSLDG